MSEKTKEKTCAFYASDYHFEMISLPFIEKNLESNKEIIVLTENDLEDTMKVLISKINWNHDDLKKFKQIKKNMEENKNTIIFIKGKENYIKNINKNIEKWVENNSNAKIIDCYDINEIESNLTSVMGSYNNILNTSGETKIENL